jgi:hypothetical protein
MSKAASRPANPATPTTGPFVAAQALELVVLVPLEDEEPLTLPPATGEPPVLVPLTESYG